MESLPDQIIPEDTELRATTLTVVGIGASAGGLEALTTFFTHLPLDSGFAFIIVTHLSPDRPSLLPELLQKHTLLPIHIAENGMALKANQIFICPEGKELAVNNHQLQLISNPKHIGAYHPIDAFLQSLAQDCQTQSIGIILSGTGTDGTLGIKAIKDVAGITFAQDPSSAGYDGMPNSAIASGDIDFVLPAEDIGAQLIACYQTFADKTVRNKTEQSIDNESLHKILDLLHEQLGHDFSKYKISTIQRRIARRMSIHQLNNVQLYIQFLTDNPIEQEQLLQELLINVTSFFRDSEAFDALAALALPMLFANKPNDYKLRIWVTACSTGEEAYSLAILFHEYSVKIGKPLRLQLFATDLDASCISKARTGNFPLSIASELSAERLARYFSLENNEYRINKAIRETVIFAQHNLISDPPFTRMDLISCRNLLIYLDAELQKQIIPIFHYALNPDGILFLGSAESIGSFNQLFTCLHPKWKFYQRSAELKQALTPLTLRKPLYSRRFEQSLNEIAPEHRKETTTLQVEHFLLDKYVPISFIINIKGKIFYIHGQSGAYIQPPTGLPNWNIIEMTKEGLRFPLASSLRLAEKNTDNLFIHKNVNINNDGHIESIDLTIERINNPEALRNLFLVSIFPSTLAAPELNATLLLTPSLPSEKDNLEHELYFTKESLNATIADLEISNEELQSSNEELQSTNEELETTKEEMQSLNEELSTINTELQKKIESLSEANDDMQNLLNGTDIASIFLDCDLHIKRYTRQAKNIFKLIDADTGRPLADLASNLRYDNLLDDAQQVLETLVIKEAEVQTLANDWYLMRILPYRTTENIIDGLAINFININKLKVAELYAHEAYLMTAIVNTVPQPMLVLDHTLRISLVNPAYLKNYGLNHDDFIGQSLFSIHNNAFNTAPLRDLLNHTISHNQAFTDFQVDVLLPQIGIKPLLLAGCILKLSQNIPSHILLSINERPS